MPIQTKIASQAKNVSWYLRARTGAMVVLSAALCPVAAVSAQDSDRARFDNSVRNGKNQMPPWKGVLTDEEIDRLWHYIPANAYQK